MIIFNIVGVVMVIVGAALGYGVSALIGSTADGPMMLLIGSVCILFDTTYRIWQPNGHWVSPFGGGHIFFLPIWLIGAAWIVVGAFNLFTRPAPIGLLGSVVVGFLVVAALGLTAFQIIAYNLGSMPRAGERGAPQAKNGVIRCPECNMPCDSEKITDGSCTWCGANVE